MSASAYDSYGTWKAWAADDFLRYSADEARYFDGELAGLALPGKRVLEIGFGNGNFLGYARDRGASIAGTEVIDEAVARAKRAQVKVYASDLSDAVATHAQFDLVAAFDVFEHLSREELSALFTQLEEVMPTGARIIARFPNGQSPLGRVHQYGDATHRLVLSPEILLQLVRRAAWRVERASNPYVVIGGGVARRAVQSMRKGFRRTVELGVNALYGLSITLDPNVVVVLERTSSRGANEAAAR